jgi:hypothetical protein
MATGGKPDRRAAIELAPAAERGEHWLPVAVAIIAVAGLHVALPARYRVRPGWVIPAALLALLAVLIAGDPGRIGRQRTWLPIITSIVIALRWSPSRAPRIVLFAPSTPGHGPRPYLGPFGPAPQNTPGSEGTKAATCCLFRQLSPAIQRGFGCPFTGRARLPAVCTIHDGLELR